ncbi:hypothetical protein EYF80_028837 [Liparis tanakae]|uniref:Uncharacterized protein n=1 Tax=Liparis tanakae TaxID=230148 RepID=A0A4Z2H516_9TELE|nr:hypothetical protein EYF80_028837 [Liparis tanakae]
MTDGRPCSAALGVSSTMPLKKSRDERASLVTLMSSEDRISPTDRDASGRYLFILNWVAILSKHSATRDTCVTHLLEHDGEPSSTDAWSRHSLLISAALQPAALSAREAAAAVKADL